MATQVQGPNAKPAPRFSSLLTYLPVAGFIVTLAIQLIRGVADWAAIIVFSIFMLGAAAGHVRSTVRDRNMAPGNAGYIFWYDIIAPLLLVGLYIATM
jgi:hypothetical protein